MNARQRVKNKQQKLSFDSSTNNFLQDSINQIGQLSPF